jgi:hypothetical protein
VRALKKLSILKGCLSVLLGLCIALFVLGGLFQSMYLSIVGLMIFTALCGLLTYYVVIKQENNS